MRNILSLKAARLLTNYCTFFGQLLFRTFRYFTHLQKLFILDHFFLLFHFMFPMKRLMWIFSFKRATFSLLCILKMKSFSLSEAFRTLDMNFTWRLSVCFISIIQMAFSFITCLYDITKNSFWLQFSYGQVRNWKWRLRISRSRIFRRVGF